MGLSAKVGNFALNTNTGNQSVTGVGFEPKVVLFFPTNDTADGVSAHAHIGFGAGISSTARAAITSNDEDAQGTTDNAREHTDALCIVHNVAGSGAADYEADFVSLDADGFTINITNAPSSAKRVGYLALGGTDLTNVATGYFQADNATGDQAVTGIGFQPDVVMFFNIGYNTAPPNSHGHLLPAIGFAVSSSKRAATTCMANWGQATSDTARQQRTDACILIAKYDGTLNGEADFVSHDADGFTVNWSNADDSYCFYIALKGGQYDVGSLTTQTGTGNFSETSLGFTGAALLLLSFCNPTNAGEVAGAELSIGLAASSSEQFVAGCTSEDGQATSDCDSFQDDGLIYQNYDFAQGVEGAAAFVSFNADGFTLNQTDADPAGNEMIWLVIGAAAVVGQPVTIRTFGIPTGTGARNRPGGWN